MEWLPIAAATIAGLMVFPYTTPEILLKDAPKFDGNQVIIVGGVVQERGNWFTLASTGRSIDVYHASPPPTGSIVEVTGRLEGNQLFADAWKTAASEENEVTMAALQSNPARYLHQQITIKGTGTPAGLEASGATLPTSELLSGPVRVQGTLQYQPDCLCHHLVIHSSTSL